MTPSAKHKPHKLEKGLTLQQRPRTTSLCARAYVDGKEHYLNTETEDFDRAERLAQSWFARLKSDGGNGSREHVTMHEAAKSFIRDIRKPVRKAYHQQKWNAMSDFFKAIDVDAVNTPMLKKFMRWEKRAHVKLITQAKDLVTLRCILRHAVEEGWLTALPVFPRVGKLDANPRPWFTPEQWVRLIEHANERVEIAKDEAGNHRHKRQDLLEFLQLQVATCMRVDELRSVRVCDVKVMKSKRETVGGQTLPPAVLALVKKNKTNVTLDANEYLEIDLQQGKTGPRTVLTRPAFSGVAAFRSVVKTKNLQPDDLLFDTHHRDAFRELLLDPKVNLREHNGIKRNLKAVRCTGIMLWILAEPNVNLKLLASNCGTSIAMLDAFYMKPLNVKLNREALVS